MSRNIWVGLAVVVVAVIAWVVIDGFLRPAQVADDAQVTEPLTVEEAADGDAVIVADETSDVEAADSELVGEPATEIGPDAVTTGEPAGSELVVEDVAAPGDDAAAPEVELSEAAEAVAEGGADAATAAGDAVTDAAAATTDAAEEVAPATGEGAGGTVVAGDEELIPEGEGTTVPLGGAADAAEAGTTDDDLTTVDEAVGEAVGATNGPTGTEAQADAAAEPAATDAPAPAQDGATVTTVPIEPVEQEGETELAAAGTEATTVPVEPATGGGASVAPDETVTLADGTEVTVDELFTPEGFDADAAIAYVGEADLSGVVRTTLTAALEQARDAPELVGEAVAQARDRLGLPPLE